MEYLNDCRKSICVGPGTDGHNIIIFCQKSKALKLRGHWSHYRHNGQNQLEKCNVYILLYVPQENLKHNNYSQHKF